MSRNGAAADGNRNIIGFGGDCAEGIIAALNISADQVRILNGNFRAAGVIGRAEILEVERCITGHRAFFDSYIDRTEEDNSISIVIGCDNSAVLDDKLQWFGRVCLGQCNRLGIEDS